MKITRILPRSLAIGFQKHIIERDENELKHYRVRVFLLEESIQEGYNELSRLEEKN